MINEKMQALGRERSVIRELFEYGLKRKAEIGEDAVFDFSLGNPSVPAPSLFDAELIRLLGCGDSVSLHGYTSAPGNGTVREAVAEHIRKRFGFPARADRIYMTAGAAAALTSALTAVVCPGDEVITVAPYFPEYKVFIERCGGRMISVRARDDFQPDTEAIASAITERTAAIIINSPNNPSGAVYTEKSISLLAEILRESEKRYSHPIYLIADEPYRELVYDGISVPYIPKFYADTIVCYSFSKSLSIPGERIGYVMVSGEASFDLEVFEAVCGAARALGFVCAPSLMQAALPTLLELTVDVSVYDENRRLFLSALTSYGFETVSPDGAFYLLLRSPSGSGEEFSERAKQNEILVVPSESFGYGGYVRIAYCVNKEQIERALPAFRALAMSYGLGERK